MNLNTYIKQYVIKNEKDGILSIKKKMHKNMKNIVVCC